LWQDQCGGLSEALWEGSKFQYIEIKIAFIYEGHEIIPKMFGSYSLSKWNKMIVIFA